MIGPDAVRKVAKVPPSDNTVFCLQLDYYTDISKNAQLLANVRFVDGDAIRENFFLVLQNTRKNNIRNFSCYDEIS